MKKRNDEIQKNNFMLTLPYIFFYLILFVSDELRAIILAKELLQNQKVKVNHHQQSTGTTEVHTVERSKWKAAAEQKNQPKVSREGIRRRDTKK